MIDLESRYHVFFPFLVFVLPDVCPLEAGFLGVSYEFCWMGGALSESSTVLSADACGWDLF